MSVTTQKMTAAEFMELPEVQNGAQWELVDGRIVVSPRPSRIHGYTSIALGQLLFNHVQAHNLGIVYLEVDTIFAIDEVRAPDILYYSNSRLPPREVKVPNTSPDLCVEILSPSN